MKTIRRIANRLLRRTPQRCEACHAFLNDKRAETPVEDRRQGVNISSVHVREHIPIKDPVAQGWCSHVTHDLVRVDLEMGPVIIATIVLPATVAIEELPVAAEVTLEVVVQ
jgi:hypothetical protein